MVSLTSVEYFGDWPNRWLHNLHRRYSTDFCYIFSERIYLTWCDWRRRENRRLLLFTMFTYLLTVHLGAQSWQVYAEGSEPSIEVLPGSVDDSERIHGMDYDQVNSWCTEVPLCTHSAKAWIRRAGDKVEQMTCRRKSWKLFIYLHVYKYLNIYFLSLFFFLLKSILPAAIRRTKGDYVARMYSGGGPESRSARRRDQVMSRFGEEWRSEEFGETAHKWSFGP